MAQRNSIEYWRLFIICEFLYWSSLLFGSVGFHGEHRLGSMVN